MNRQMLEMMLSRIEASPQYASNPNAKAMVECIRSNDSQRGREIASNLCQTYGITPEQAVQRARGMFGI